MLEYRLNKVWNVNRWKYSKTHYNPETDNILSRHPDFATLILTFQQPEWIKYNTKIIKTKNIDSMSECVKILECSDCLKTPEMLLWGVDKLPFGEPHLFAINDLCAAHERERKRRLTSPFQIPPSFSSLAITSVWSIGSFETSYVCSAVFRFFSCFVTFRPVEPAVVDREEFASCEIPGARFIEPDCTKLIGKLAS